MLMLRGRLETFGLPTSLHILKHFIRVAIRRGDHKIAWRFGYGYVSLGRTLVIQKIFRAYPKGFLYSHIYMDMLMELSCN